MTNETSQLISGVATAESTKAYADKVWKNFPKISPNSWRVWEGLTLGKVMCAPAYPMPLQDTISLFKGAIMHGINTFMLADPISQMAMHEVLQDKSIKRDMLVLLVMVSAEDAAAAMRAAADRIGVETLEGACVYLAGKITADKALSLFKTLETACQEKSALYYGVASEALVLKKDDEQFTDLAVLNEAAQEAAQQIWKRRKRPLFRFLNVPFNVLEMGALREMNTAAKTIGSSVPATTLDLAARMNLGVFAARPLTAFHEGQAYRLTAASIEAEAQDMQVSLGKVVLAERKLNDILSGWPSLEGTPLFNFTQHGSQILQEVTSRASYLNMIEGVVRPQARVVLQNISEAGLTNESVATALAIYQQFSDLFFEDLWKKNSQADARNNAVLGAELLARVPEEWTDKPLHILASAAITSTPGVTGIAYDFARDLALADVVQFYESGDFADALSVLGFSE